jgi:hypothetical protein
VLKLLTDEHIDPDLIRGLQARQSDLDVIRVHDVRLLHADDRDILAWAAGEQPPGVPGVAPPQARVLVTHDRNTVPGFAYDRVRAGQPMTGVVVVDDRLSLGRMIDELLVVAVCTAEGELRDQVIYVPL